jgi:hypothetical protein
MLMSIPSPTTECKNRKIISWRCGLITGTSRLYSQHVDVFFVEEMASGGYIFRSWNQLLSLEVYWSL